MRSCGLLTPFVSCLSPEGSQVLQVLSRLTHRPLEASSFEERIMPVKTKRGFSTNDGPSTVRQSRRAGLNLLLSHPCFFNRPRANLSSINSFLLHFLSSRATILNQRPRRYRYRQIGGRSSRQRSVLFASSGVYLSTLGKLVLSNCSLNTKDGPYLRARTLLRK